jgi:CoA:oxalate CoA-transferase
MPPAEPTTERGLFEGLRVIELGQYVAAPLCAELFANGGAEVVSVEPITGTPTRFSPPGAPDGIQFVSKSRGKRSISLALNTDSGRAIARRICLDADIVISNMRPGAAARLGLDYESLAAENPAIIVGEVDAFGERDGEPSKAGVDIVAQAASGLLTSFSLTTDPVVVRDVLLTDVGAGILLAFGVSSALWARERTGRGQRVATSLVSAALAMQVRTAHVVPGADDDAIERVDALSAGARFEDVLDQRISASNRMYPTYDVFATATGWVAVGAVRHNAHVLYAFAGVDPAPEKLGGRTVSEALRAALAEVDADDMVAHLEAAGIPVAPVRLLEEVLVDPESVRAGLVDDFEHERLGRVRLPAAPLRFSDARYRTGRTTPELGEHTVTELRRLGFDDATIEAMVSEGVVVGGHRSTNDEQEGAADG